LIPLPKTINENDDSVRVLIADSHFLITESLKFILQNENKFIVSGIVVEKEELIVALTREYFSLLIIDPSFIELSGFSELGDIKKGFPDLQILVITNSLNKSELHDLNGLGITNIILKTAGREEIFEAVSATLKGKKYYSNDLLDLLFESSEKKKSGEETGQLTTSEIEIVRLISEGLTTKEIASRRVISFHTVISHRKNIFRKLGVSSVSELIMYAIRAGWINTIEYYI